MPAGNKKNLRPQNTRTKAEQREIATMGGKASGEARRRKKALRDVVDAVLTYKPTRETVAALQQHIMINHKNINADEAIALAQIIKAMQGDTAAATWVRDTAGEKPGERVALEQQGAFEVNIKVVE